ncbi:MAG TPA: ATP-binding cassette domain-containing protein, partial [Geobacteraceae bacterium]
MDTLLSVRGLTARYGLSQVLYGVDFECPAGQCVSLLGRNGMGKSTTLKCIMGLIKPVEGSITLGGRAITGLPS